MKAPLPWVKWWTKVLHSPTWRTAPIDERGVYSHLILLGGVSSRRGFIKGTDEEIAGLIGCSSAVVTRAIDRFAAKPYLSLRRTRNGVAILGWFEYQAPANYDPEGAYGRLSADRKCARFEHGGGGR